MCGCPKLGFRVIWELHNRCFGGSGGGKGGCEGGYGGPKAVVLVDGGAKQKSKSDGVGAKAGVVVATGDES